MSVTKLKTVGNWQAYWQNNAIAELRTNVRGRVITGMLTGDDVYADALAVAQDQHKGRT